MSFPNPTTPDPTDLILTRAMNDWLSRQSPPRWVRQSLLRKAAWSSEAHEGSHMIPAVLNWLRLRTYELLSLFISDEPVIFSPSLDNYFYSHQPSPCLVRSRVVDTFLLGSNLYSLMG
jgi:hypothetical protein